MPDLTIDIQIQNLLVAIALRVGGALAVLLVGRWVAGLARRSVRVALKRTTASPSIAEVIVRTAYYGILVLSVFVALVILGFSPEALLAVIGVVAIVAAVALRESLRDVAATVIFIIFQPFKAGDLIETNGVVGHVQEILLFNTVLITLDNRKLILPNGNIQNSNLVNYSGLENIRLDLPVRLSYANQLDEARAVLLELANADPRTLRDPAAWVDVMELGETGYGLVLRLFCKSEDIWALRPAMNERVKREFDRRGLRVPYPQLDLHLNPNGVPVPIPDGLKGQSAVPADDTKIS